MSEAGHTRWKDDVAAYVLGALGRDEAMELERHLESCAECRAELRWLRPAVDLLPERVERVGAPAELRTKIIEQVRAEPGPAAARPERPPAARGWLRGWRPVAALGVVAMAIAVAVGYAIGGGDTGGEATTVAAGKPPAVTAKLVMDGDSGTLRLANVGEMPEDRVLEAWIQRGGEVTPVKGLFLPDSAGRATTTIPDLDGVEAVMVTSEPDGGSRAPTGAPMVTLEMPA